MAAGEVLIGQIVGPLPFCETLEEAEGERKRACATLTLGAAGVGWSGPSLAALLMPETFERILTLGETEEGCCSETRLGQKEIDMNQESRSYWMMSGGKRRTWHGVTATHYPLWFASGWDRLLLSLRCVCEIVVSQGRTQVSVAGHWTWSIRSTRKPLVER